MGLKFAREECADWNCVSLNPSGPVAPHAYFVRGSVGSLVKGGGGYRGASREAHTQ